MCCSVKPTRDSVSAKAGTEAAKLIFIRSQKGRAVNVSYDLDLVTTFLTSFYLCVKLSNETNMIFMEYGKDFWLNEGVHSTVCSPETITSKPVDIHLVQYGKSCWTPSRIHYILNFSLQYWYVFHFRCNYLRYECTSKLETSAKEKQINTFKRFFWNLAAFKTKKIISRIREIK